MERVDSSAQKVRSVEIKEVLICWMRLILGCGKAEVGARGRGSARIENTYLILTLMIEEIEPDEGDVLKLLT